MKWKWEKLATTQLPNRLGKNWKGAIFYHDIKVHTHPTCQIELPLWNMQRREDGPVSLFLFIFFLSSNETCLVQCVFIFNTAFIWNDTICSHVANYGGNSFHQSFPPHRDCVCVVAYERPVGRSPQRRQPPNPHHGLILITINSLNPNLCLTSTPMLDHQLCEHWLGNNHLLNFHTGFLDKQTFELFFCLAVPVK